MHAGEAEPAGTIGSHFYHPRYGEKPLCLNLDMSNDDVASETTKKKYDGELYAESVGTTNDAELHLLKDQEKTTTHPPEQPDEDIQTTSDVELDAESLRTKNDGVLNAESIMTMTNAELHVEKHQEKTITDEPEPPTCPRDKRLQNSPIPATSSYGMPPKLSNVLYTDAREPTAQGSRRRARTYAGEAALRGTIGSNLYHPQYGENSLCLTLNVSNEKVEKHLEKTTSDEPEQCDERTRMTNDGEFNAEQHHEKTRMTNHREFNSAQHHERTGMMIDGEFNAEKHQRLTFAGGTRVPGASNLTRRKKEVIRASTLWFASDRCYEDELRDGIG
jgi:hypothetical protein